MASGTVWPAGVLPPAAHEVDELQYNLLPKRHPVRWNVDNAYKSKLPEYVKMEISRAINSSHIKPRDHLGIFSFVNNDYHLNWPSCDLYCLENPVHINEVFVFIQKAPEPRNVELDELYAYEVVSKHLCSPPHIENQPRAVVPFEVDESYLSAPHQLDQDLTNYLDVIKAVIQVDHGPDGLMPTHGLGRLVLFDDLDGSLCKGRDAYKKNKMIHEVVTWRDTEKNALKRLVQQVEQIWEAVTRNGTKTTTTGKIPASTLILRNPELLAREEEKVFMRWNRERVAFFVYEGELKIHVLGHGYYEVEKKKLLLLSGSMWHSIVPGGAMYIASGF